MVNNYRYNKKCIQGNTVYYKLQISDMIKHQVDKLGADSSKYKQLESVISSNIKFFSKKMLKGADFKETMKFLRDEVISECAEIKGMKPFFKNYIFDKIYDMGLNIDKGVIPDDCESELEQAMIKEEEERLKQENEEILEKERIENEEKLKQEELEMQEIEEEEEEKDPDLIGLAWSYFFNETAKKKKVDSKKEKDTQSKDKNEKSVSKKNVKNDKNKTNKNTQDNEYIRNVFDKLY